MRLPLIPWFLMVLVHLPLKAQEVDFRFSGEFHEAPFTEFVEAVEDQTGTSFYFREAWTREVRVSATGRDISLRQTLDRVLLPAGISYFMDGCGGVYLTRGVPIITRLPEYSSIPEYGEAAGTDTIREKLTDAEKNYMDGRRSGLLETIRIGKQGGELAGENALIHCLITDIESGEPMVGATLYFEELKKGAATDVNGLLSIAVPIGIYAVEFNCMGMADRRNYLEVLSGGNLSVAMEKSMIPLTEVTVKADRYHHVRGTQMGFDRLPSRVMNEVPVVMGEKDLLRIVQMLPGVQNVGEGAAGFNVRGSAADQNMIYVNKVPVYNINHLFGFFTSISPDIVRDFTLYKSNLPASYGGRLASFFDITARQGNMNEITARGGISPITGHVAIEGPVRKDKMAFVLSARSSYSDWILRQMEDPNLRNSDAAFHDLAGVLTWKPDEQTVVKAFGYLSRDRFNLGTTNTYDYSNNGGSLNIRRRFNSRSSGELALVYGAYEFGTVDTNVPSGSYSHHYRIGHYEVKADLTWLSIGKHRITYGGSVIWYNLDRGTIEPYGPASFLLPVELGIEDGIESGLYLADEVALLPRLTLYGGIRLSGFAAVGPEQVVLYKEGLPRVEENATDTIDFSAGQVSKAYSGVEPRISLNYMTGTNSSVKLSYNRLRQYLFMLSNTIAISPTDQWKLCDYHIRPPYADQLSVGYYIDFPKVNLSTSVELYRKWISDLVEYRDGADFIRSPHTETQLLQGEQNSYGAEAMIRKNGGKLNGWIAYSYSRSYITVDSPITFETINGGRSYPSNYDRPHNLNVVANYKINRRLSFSANLVYSTGRPVTYPISIYYSEGIQYLDYSERNSYRIPDYFRMDFSVNLEGNLKERKLFHSYWMLNVYNLTGRKNAYSVYFQNDKGTMNGYKLSIYGQPVISLSWNFKLGNYASE